MEEPDFEFIGTSLKASFYDVYNFQYDYYYSSFNGSSYHQIPYEFEVEGELPTPYLITFITAFMISVPGNVCILLSIWRNKVLHTPVWYMLGAVSISMLVDNITIPFWIIHVKNITWPFGEPLCKLLPFTNYATFGFSRLGIAGMCIMRLLSRTVMKRSLKQYPFYMTFIAVFIIGIVAISTAIPSAVFHGIENFYGHTFCFPIFPSLRSYNAWYITWFGLTFVIPLLLVWTINPVIFILRKTLFATNSTETVTYVRQYEEAQPFRGNGCTENGEITLNEYNNTNGSNGHTMMRDEMHEMNGHTAIKDDLALIVGTVNLNQELKRENMVTLLSFLLGISLTLCSGPLSIIIIIYHVSDFHELNHEVLSKASLVFHLVHSLFPATIPLLSLACSAPLRNGIVKPIRAIFPRINTYSKV